MKSSILAIFAVACTVLAAPTLHEARSPVDRDNMAVVRTTNSADDNGYGPDYAKYKTYGAYKRTAVRTTNLADDNGYGPDYAKYKSYGDYKRAVDDGGYDKYGDYGKYGKYEKYDTYGSYRDDEITTQD